MDQFDLQAAQIARQRQLADALRSSGNQGLTDFNPAAMAGRMVYRRSPLENLAAVAKIGLGAYGDYRAGEDEKANNAARTADLQNKQQGLVDALRGRESTGIMPNSDTSPQMPDAAPVVAAPPMQPNDLSPQSLQDAMSAPPPMPAPGSSLGASTAASTGMPFSPLSAVRLPGLPGGPDVYTHAPGTPGAIDLNPQRTMLAGALRGMDPAAANSFLQQQVLSQAFPSKKDLITVADGGAIFDPTIGKKVFENPKEVKPKDAPAAQKLDSGLIFHPDAADPHVTDSTGKRLSSAEVAAYEANAAGQKAFATEGARNKAKLAQFPEGSQDYNVEWSLQHGGNVPPGISRGGPVALAAFGAAMKARAAVDGNPLAMQIADARIRESAGPAMKLTQTQLANNQSFAGTMHKNIADADTLEKQYGGMDSPVLNKAFQQWRNGVTGDPDTAPIIAKLNIYNTAIRGEAAKINTGGVGSVSSASDAAIKEQEKNLSTAMSYKVWRGSVDALQKESVNRVSQLQETLTGLRNQSASTHSDPTKEAVPNNPATAPTVPGATETRVIGGVTYHKVNGQWVQ
jgi:hypothetical protein